MTLTNANAAGAFPNYLSASRPAASGARVAAARQASALKRAASVVRTKQKPSDPKANSKLTGPATDDSDRRQPTGGAFNKLIHFLLQPAAAGAPTNGDIDGEINDDGHHLAGDHVSENDLPGNDGSADAFPANNWLANHWPAKFITGTNAKPSSQNAGARTATSAQIADALIQSMLGPSALNESSKAFSLKDASLKDEALEKDEALDTRNGSAPGLLARVARGKTKSDGNRMDPAVNLVALFGLNGAGLLAQRPVAAQTADAGVVGTESSALVSGDQANRLPVSTTAQGPEGLAFGALLKPNQPTGSVEESHAASTLAADGQSLGKLGLKKPGPEKEALESPADSGGILLKSAPAAGFDAEGQNSSSADSADGDTTPGRRNLSDAPTASPEQIAGQDFASIPMLAQSSQLSHHSSSASSGPSSSPSMTEAQRAAEATEAPAPVALTRIHDLTVRVSPADASPVDLQLSQRSGEIRVAVRTDDSTLQSSLRQNLPNLVQSLDKAGFHTETFLPHNGLAEAVPGLNVAAATAGAGGNQNAEHQQSPPQDGSSRQGGFQQNQSQQNQSQQNNFQQNEFKQNKQRAFLRGSRQNGSPQNFAQALSQRAAPQ